MAGPGFCWEQNNLELLGKQATKTGERLCIQGRVLLESITPRPGSLLDPTEMASLPVLQRNSVETKPESSGLPLSLSALILFWRGELVGVSPQTGRAVIGELLPLCV